jgi:hypothetical protein
VQSLITILSNLYGSLTDDAEHIPLKALQSIHKLQHEANINTFMRLTQISRLSAATVFTWLLAAFG